jgi:hypothetical protein
VLLHQHLLTPHLMPSEWTSVVPIFQRRELRPKEVNVWSRTEQYSTPKAQPSVWWCYSTEMSTCAIEEAEANPSALAAPLT